MDNDRTVADDPVVFVLHRSQVEEDIPLYSGGVLPLSRVSEGGIKLYAFPLSRLNVVGELKTPTAPINAINPSPYHARTFDASANRKFIESIRDAGGLPGSVRVRVLQHRPLKLELLNDHKRVWGACVAGFEKVPVWRSTGSRMGKPQGSGLVSIFRLTHLSNSTEPSNDYKTGLDSWS